MNDEATLLYLVNQGTLTFHVWASRVQDLDRPDFVLFDLDPGKAASRTSSRWRRPSRRRWTRRGRVVREDLGQDGPARPHALDETAGSTRRGLGAGARRAVAEAMPDRATVEIRKAKRGDRVYIDVMQNARGHHAVPPYVLRAVPGATSRPRWTGKRWPRGSTRGRSR